MNLQLTAFKGFLVNLDNEMPTDSGRYISNGKRAIFSVGESSILLGAGSEDKSLESEMGPHLLECAFFASQCTFCFSESGLDPIIVSVAIP